VAKRDLCSGPWVKAYTASVWLARAKVKDKRGARAWAKAHGHKTEEVLTNSTGEFFVVRLFPKNKFRCYRYGPWLDKGRTRFLFGGNPKRR